MKILTKFLDGRDKVNFDNDIDSTVDTVKDEFVMS